MPGEQRLRLLAAYVGARRRRFADRDALESWQESRLAVVLERARATFPFHRAALPPGPVTLADAPILTKDVWLDRFAELNAAGLGLEQCLAAARAAEQSRDFSTALGGLSVGLSSGTSGRQGVFLTSPAERARWAGTILARALPGGLTRRERVALVLRAGGPLYAAVGGARTAFRHVDLLAPMPRQLAALESFAPTVLAAPPAALQQYAAAVRNGQVLLSPSVIYSVADVLEPDVEAAVAAAFEVPVGQVYQATEGFLGITCARGTMHLNEDLLVVERDVIDAASGRFVPVVTDLWRTSQAVIRYRMGDVLRPAREPCPCGSVLAAVDRIEGREDDVLQLRGVDGVPVPVFADAVRAAVLGVPGVVDFRVVQHQETTVDLAVAPAGRWAEAAAALTRWLAESGAVGVGIRPMDWPPPDAAAKVRRVRRSVPA